MEIPPINSDINNGAKWNFNIKQRFDSSEYSGYFTTDTYVIRYISTPKSRTEFYSKANQIWRENVLERICTWNSIRHNSKWLERDEESCSFDRWLKMFWLRFSLKNVKISTKFDTFLEFWFDLEFWYQILIIFELSQHYKYIHFKDWAHPKCSFFNVQQTFGISWWLLNSFQPWLMRRWKDDWILTVLLL